MTWLVDLSLQHKILSRRSHFESRAKQQMHKHHGHLAGYFLYQSYRL